MRLHNRLVKAEFWTDIDLICDFSRDERMFYQGLWQLADDSGCLENNPRAFKLHLFPMDEDINPDLLAEWLGHLVTAGKVQRYEVGGKRCLYLANFHKHQTIKNPSAPDTPLPPWLRWESYPANPRAGHYTISDSKEGPTDTALTDDLQGTDTSLLIEPNRREVNINHVAADAAVTPLKSSERREKKVYTDDTPAYRLSLYLRERIEAEHPETKLPLPSPEGLADWSHHADLLLRRDQRPRELVKQVIDWAVPHEFWGANVLSVRTLRKHFDQMVIQLRQGPTGRLTGNARNERRQPNGRKIEPGPEYETFRAPQRANTTE